MDSFTTAQGLTAADIAFDIGGGIFRGRRLLYVHDGHIGFGAAYIVPSGQYQELESLIVYSFCSFRVNGEDSDQAAIEECFRNTKEANTFREQGREKAEEGDFEQAVIYFGKGDRASTGEQNSLHIARCELLAATRQHQGTGGTWSAR